jgi:hypothetical protein
MIKRIYFVVLIFLGDSPTSEFSVSTFCNTLFHFYRSFKQRVKIFEEEIECSEMSVQKIQTPVESYTRNNTAFKTGRKFEIKNIFY